MNYNQIHTIMRNFNEVACYKFAKQLTDIDSAAALCHQSHYNKFTISLFSKTSSGKLNTVQIETEHLVLISDFKITPEIEQLTQDLTKFIMNEPEE